MATREAIIEAAARVFQTKGYHAASVQDVADAVGILKGSLYHHIESKEELLYLIVKEPRARLYRAVAEIVADDAAPAGIPERAGRPRGGPVVRISGSALDPAGASATGRAPPPGAPVTRAPRRPCRSGRGFP
jgi:AcrR family transcriptional regulator